MMMHVFTRLQNRKINILLILGSTGKRFTRKPHRSRSILTVYYVYFGPALNSKDRKMNFLIIFFIVKHNYRTFPRYFCTDAGFRRAGKAK